MFKSWVNKVRRYRFVSLLFGLSLILIWGGWVRAFFATRGIDQPLIIHFNNFTGINQVGSIMDLSAAGLLGTVAVILDGIIALELEEKDRFLGKLVAAAGLGFSILIFIGFTAIIAVN